MKEQLTLGTGFEKYSKTTRREKFLTEMDRIVPWGELCALIAPVYPKAGDGRPPKELEMMLRVYFLQQWFNLSDPGVEEALYDSVSMRRFAGIDLGEMPVPDESTVLRFRHLLEAHGLGKKLFQQVHAYLERQGIKVGTGTIVDATIISAPPSTKNKDKSRDPDMHQDEEGQSVVFRDESAHRRGQPDQGHPRRGRHPGECARFGVPPRPLAWGGDPPVGGLGLSRTNRGHPKACAQGQRPHEPSLPVPGRRQ